MTPGPLPSVDVPDPRRQAEPSSGSAPLPTRLGVTEPRPDEPMAVVVAGPAGAPSLTVRTDARSFFSLGMRQLDPIEALVSGQVAAVGVPAAVTRCLRLLGITPDVAVSTDRLADVGPAPV